MANIGSWHLRAFCTTLLPDWPWHNPHLHPMMRRMDINRKKKKSSYCILILESASSDPLRFVLLLFRLNVDRIPSCMLSLYSALILTTIWRRACSSSTSTSRTVSIRWRDTGIVHTNEISRNCEQLGEYWLIHKCWTKCTTSCLENEVWYISSVKSQKGVNSGQRCSVENQKGARSMYKSRAITPFLFVEQR